MRLRVADCGPAAAPVALSLAGSLDAALLDTTGRVAAAAAGRGPDARDVLAGRATVAEACRSRDGVPVVGWGGALDASEVESLARRVEEAVGVVVVFGWRAVPG